MEECIVHEYLGTMKCVRCGMSAREAAKRAYSERDQMPKSLTHEDKILKRFTESYAQVTDRECLFIKRLRKGGLRTAKIAVVIKVMEETCPHCYDDDKTCRFSGRE